MYLQLSGAATTYDEIIRLLQEGKYDQIRVVVNRIESKREFTLIDFRPEEMPRQSQEELIKTRRQLDGLLRSLKEVRDNTQWFEDEL